MGNDSCSKGSVLEAIAPGGHCSGRGGLLEALRLAVCLYRAILFGDFRTESHPNAGSHVKRGLRLSVTGQGYYHARGVRDKAPGQACSYKCSIKHLDGH